MWPAGVVRNLRPLLPAGYVAAPTVHLGSPVEIDAAAFRHDQPIGAAADTSPGGEATAAGWAAGEPAVAVETEVPDYDEYEVRVYDTQRGRQLVAAVEIVSPGNKGRPDARNAFVGQCAALLRGGVAVTVVDVVTVRQSNLYAELLAFIGHRDSTLPVPRRASMRQPCGGCPGR